jgi:hypothetical protein
MRIRTLGDPVCRTEVHTAEHRADSTAGAFLFVCVLPLCGRGSWHSIQHCDISYLTRLLFLLLLACAVALCVVVARAPLSPAIWDLPLPFREGASIPR